MVDSVGCLVPLVVLKILAGKDISVVDPCRYACVETGTVLFVAEVVVGALWVNHPVGEPKSNGLVETRLTRTVKTTKEVVGNIVTMFLV